MKSFHTLIVGSGAAGLRAAIELDAKGVAPIGIVTEGLDMGASINTGSDKQTYYKLSLCGNDDDSPVAMAETLFDGGSVHGDLALVEAACSTRAFFRLVELGVPFPTDAYGQFIGYKTDHDSRRRATSIGPFTSREMCRALIREARRRRIPVFEGCVAARLAVSSDMGRPRVHGAAVAMPDGTIEGFAADAVVLAVGGPGGLYERSVYPGSHRGGIGLGLEVGARARNLPESQFGLASTDFRWNVSGTYMQVVPRVISRDASGIEREFIFEALGDANQVSSLVFLKGYQWPFDALKAQGGSSLIDLLVFRETAQLGRRVFLDFRRNGIGFSFEGLGAEARDYLERSGARQATPIERLRHMNPGAVAHYLDRGIDLAGEPLAVDICAQHNNGGLAGNAWWESENIRGLFPVGEVNGSHGVCRPGGAALNAGQVGALRAADYIAARYSGATERASLAARACVSDAVSQASDWLSRGTSASRAWEEETIEAQIRMSARGAHIRSVSGIAEAVSEARAQWERIDRDGCRWTPGRQGDALFARHLCLAQYVYLSAIRTGLDCGVGSRGSVMALSADGVPVHSCLDDSWRMAPENRDFRGQVLETEWNGREVVSSWLPVRPIPQPDTWFETAWAAFRAGTIYGESIE